MARRSSIIRTSQQALFAFHRDAANLPRISPPLPRVRVIAASTPLCEGDLQRIELRFGVVHVPWAARITKLAEPTLIEDVQASGPFRRWRHRHRVAAHPQGAMLTDEIVFRLIPTPFGEFTEYWLVRPALLAMLWWRHRQTRRLLEAAD